MKNLNFIVGLGCLLAIFSYDFEMQKSENSKMHKDVWVENGILCFRDFDTYEETIMNLHDKGVNFLEEWEEAIGFNNSYRNYVDNYGSWSDDELIMPDKFFATIINRNGLFSVGDSLHCLTYDLEYVVKKSEFKSLNDLFITSKNNLRCNKIERRLLSQETLKSVSGWEKQFNDDPCGLNNGHGYEYKCWCVNTLFYGSIGLRLTGREQESDGDWHDERFDYGKVSGTAYFRLNWQSGQMTDSNSDEEYNKKNVDCTLTWSVLNITNCDSIKANYIYEQGNCEDAIYNYIWK